MDHFGGIAQKWKNEKETNKSNKGGKRMKLFVGKNNEKYDFWDVSRDRKKKPITLSDRILELVAAAMAVLLLILTGVLYSKAPDTVPSHFNLAMEVDAWSGKGVYWVLAAIMLVGMIICASAAYNRKLVNLPIRLKEPVFYHQIGLISRMCRIMTITFGLIWLAVLLAMSASFIGMPEDVSVALIPLSVMLMLGVVLFYTLKIWWIGRNV
jgi:hypothetical protein